MRKIFLLIFLCLTVLLIAASCSKENEASQDNGSCTTEDLSFATDIQPIFNTYCTSCHNSSNTSGGQNLTNFEGVMNAIDNGKLIGVITHASGYPAMPQGAAKLSDCNISKISAWITQGALNN